MWLIMNMEEFANNGINIKNIATLTLTSTTDKKTFIVVIRDI